MQVSDLGAYGASPALIRALDSAGVKDLYPPQVLAVESGLLRSRDSWVIAAPTASGKTLIAEMAILENFLARRGKSLYLVPLRALAREKYDDISHRYRGAGLRVFQTTGDLDSAEPWLIRGDLVIATNEKLDSLLRHRAPWLKDVKVVVADEVHLLRDPHRGPTLEVVLTRLRSSLSGIRSIALSATIPNAREIADWLGARLIESAWRPVPLREGVYYNGAAIFHDGTVKWVEEESALDIVNLALDTLKEGGQALFFVNTRKSTEAAARTLGKYVEGVLSPEEAGQLAALSEEVLNASAEPTRQCRRLAEAVGRGVAFHHAGVLSSQRKLVEDAFRKNILKVLTSTTTLAMGLNLPSRRVVIRDWWRYESGMGMQPMPAIEIKQMGGRAGRPLFDQYGEAVLVARNKEDEKFLFQNYIRGDLEKITSRLGNESVLRTHVLASIAGLFARTGGELKDFFEKTFFALQRGKDSLFPVVEGIVSFLQDEGMVLSADDRLKASRFGRRVSELYLDPVSGVILRDALRMEKEKSDFALLHLIARAPDMMTLSLRKRDRDEMIDLYYSEQEGLLVPEEEMFPSDDLLAQLKTAATLAQWIDEIPEDKIVTHFGIGPGDLRTLVELADWLLYAASELSKIFRTKTGDVLARLRLRVQYGVKEELLELVSLRGIGRVRARNLYQAGFRNRKSIAEATPEELSRIPALGKAIAEDIKKQAQGEKPERRGAR